jgi:Wax ester synthase-like Acyl-CoA acyltransferase domain
MPANDQLTALDASFLELEEADDGAERDRRFEIDGHVRHPTPVAGGRARVPGVDLGLLLASPLWEIALLDGLAGGRWALVSKTHHCLVDGVGSVDPVHLLLGAQPAPREPPAHQSALQPRLPRHG